MLIAIWGRDGIGKSALADALGCMFAGKGVTAVIDTDLTQPSLPARVNGKQFDADTSLGRAIGMGAMDATPYLHQHPKVKTLFYIGLTDRDEYLSYEFGLEADEAAQVFVERCQEVADTVILDLSGQRCDPFMPGAFVYADKVIVLIAPDVQGVCWFNSVKPLLATMNAQDRIIPVAAMTDRHHDLSVIEKAVDVKFAATLPFVKEFRQDSTVSPLDGATVVAARYSKQVKALCALVKGAGQA